jgi:hypothetical protein
MEEGSLYHKHVDSYHRGLNYDANLIKAYTNVFAKDYRKMSEIKFLAPFKNYPLKVLGYVDGITQDDKIVDLKYGNGKPQIKNNIQGILYSSLYKFHNGHYPEFIFNWVHKKENKVKNLSVTYGSQDTKWLEDEILIPFFKDIEDIKNIKLSSDYQYHRHEYPNCPFR